MELCRYCHCPHTTSKSMTSSWGHCSTIAQTAKVSHQHITRVWCCTGTPASQGLWRQECSWTKGRWRSQPSATPRGYFWISETVLGGNRIHKDYLANHFRWEVLDVWRSLETSHWGSESLAGISRCSSRYTICVSIAQCCKCIFCFLLLNWT